MISGELPVIPATWSHAGTPREGTQTKACTTLSSGAEKQRLVATKGEKIGLKKKRLSYTLFI